MEKRENSKTKRGAPKEITKFDVSARIPDNISLGEMSDRTERKGHPIRSERIRTSTMENKRKRKT
jgi:hypothetical protein